MRPNLKKIRFGRMTEKKKFYISNAKQKTMEKRNDILLFVQNRATRENNIKGRIDLRDFGALTVGDSISLWESDFITKDEDGDTVEMSGHCVYDKVQENGQWGTFWVGETKYTFIFEKGRGDIKNGETGIEECL